ncbi:nucleoside recognition domain-containing protein [Natronolimnohabitans innermongolicus]|uniref:Ferrous iron transport protein n=1 Tax=Natronolimnohabitans innermongolicus JCM 12255 TaxID=1227499 RepID=L9XB44_9EURY|nr:nucleoside recognition domain-containing protein [Natronolimnohabitans innermongolicus]ELY58646.1 ferrous iron transport protein [Natronolimnohabitans innermongolicus JCM 12255]
MTGVDRDRVVLIGKESVGKSALAAGLTGASGAVENVAGSTVSSDVYRTDDLAVVDTPGITLEADTETTREALAALGDAETVVLVVPATALDRDLADLLPLVQGRTGAVVVTHWDHVDETGEARGAIADLEADLGVPVLPVDARKLDRVAADGGVPTGDGAGSTTHSADGRDVRAALRYAGEFPGGTAVKTGWQIEPPERIFERPLLGPIVSALVLLLPAAVAVWFANAIAGELDPLVGAGLEPAIAWAETLPGPLAAVLGGDYGLLAMGPFLFVWALPTMLIFALFTGAYSASGLTMRVTTALHPVMRRVGLTGRDLVRVVMGFGCNVPAVTSTRSCSDCTRCTTISAISFGSACSYQFPATLAVFAAVGMAWLVVPYLAILVATTLVYVRLIAPPDARTADLAVDRRTFLERPRLRAIWREARSSIASFLTTALPVFAGICVIAALFDYAGVLERAGRVLEPAMAAFALPAEAALPVVLASIRKDGIALLTADSAGVAALSPLEVLVAVYLAGVLLPCLVTAITVAREVSTRFVAAMLARQAAAAIGFALVIAWGGQLLLL